MTTGTVGMAGLEGGRVNLAWEELESLRSLVEGPLLRPGDEGWQDAALV